MLKRRHPELSHPNYKGLVLVASLKLIKLPIKHIENCKLKNIYISKNLKLKANLKISQWDRKIS